MNLADISWPNRVLIFLRTKLANFCPRFLNPLKFLHAGFYCNLSASYASVLLNAFFQQGLHFSESLYFEILGARQFRSTPKVRFGRQLCTFYNRAQHSLLQTIDSLLPQHSPFCSEVEGSRVSIYEQAVFYLIHVRLYLKECVVTATLATLVQMMFPSLMVVLLSVANCLLLQHPHQRSGQQLQNLISAAVLNSTALVKAQLFASLALR